MGERSAAKTLQRIIDTLDSVNELNDDNYDHDDVVAINSALIEIFEIIKPHLGLDK